MIEGTGNFFTWVNGMDEWWRKIITHDWIYLENVCLPKTVFSNLITESSFQCFIPKSHSLSITISQSSLNTKIDFPIHNHCSLYNQRYLLQVTKNNPLVNSWPETFLFLVKHAINEQGASKHYWNVAMSYCIAWLNINTKTHQHIAHFLTY